MTSGKAGDRPRRSAAVLRDAGGGRPRAAFDIIAHPDLVKVWGGSRPVAAGDLRRYYEPAIAAIAGSGVAVEVSTAGLRKPGL